MPYAWYAGRLCQFAGHENSGMKILAGQQGEECQNAYTRLTRIIINIIESKMQQTTKSYLQVKKTKRYS